MNPGLAIIGAAAGFIVYNEVKSSGDAVKQPGEPPKQPFWNEWFDSGDQPATGNGGNTTPDNTGRDVAGVVNSVAKFGTSLLEFIGGGNSNPNGDDNTVTSGTVGSSGKLGSAGEATEGDPSEWNMPSF